MKLKQHTVSIQIGYSTMRIAYVKGQTVLRTVRQDMPEHMFADDRLVSPSALGEFLKETLKDNGIYCKNVEFILRDDVTLLRNAVVPRLNREQTLLNIPYEFRDYAEGKLSDYIFDYEENNSSGEAGSTADILAIAVRKERIDDLRAAAQTAGMRLKKVVPALCVYEDLLRRKRGTEPGEGRLDCIIDVGYDSSRMYIFKDGHYQTSHVMDIGINRVYEELSYHYNVDVHVAKSYLMTNFENCQDSETCRMAFQEISGEVQKAINLYEYAHKTALKQFYLCGHASLYDQLAAMLTEEISGNVYKIDDEKEGLVAGKTLTGERLDDFAQVVGLAESSDQIINLAKQVEKKTNPVVLWSVAGCLVAVLALFTKFAIFDRFSALDKERADMVQMQDELDASIARMDEAGSQDTEYYHYTLDDMTEEEISRVKRAEVIGLISLISEQVDGVVSFSLKENTLHLVVATESMDNVRQLKENMETNDMVKSFIVQSSTKRAADEDEGNDVVDSQIEIVLNKV